MFVIRWGFWIAVAVMLLPTDKAQQDKLLQQATAVAQWTFTFCDRNPATCTRAGETWSVFEAKAQFALAMAGDVLRARMGDDTLSGAAAPVAGHAIATRPIAPHPRLVPASRSSTPAAAPTLTPGDGQILVRPVKPQDRLPLYRHQRADWNG